MVGGAPPPLWQQLANQMNSQYGAGAWGAANEWLQGPGGLPQWAQDKNLNATQYMHFLNQNPDAMGNKMLSNYLQQNGFVQQPPPGDPPAPEDPERQAVNAWGPSGQLPSGAHWIAGGAPGGGGGKIASDMWREYDKMRRGVQGGRGQQWGRPATPQGDPGKPVFAAHYDNRNPAGKNVSGGHYDNSAEAAKGMNMLGRPTQIGGLPKSYVPWNPMQGGISAGPPQGGGYLRGIIQGGGRGGPGGSFGGPRVPPPDARPQLSASAVNANRNSRPARNRQAMTMFG